MGNSPGMKLSLTLKTLRFLRSQTNGGIGCVMLMSTRDSPVTELAVQVIPGQEQGELFDGVHCLKKG